jgi:hypothetical protein
MFAIAVVGAFVFRTASAAVLWNEAISGDLSNNLASPTAFGTVANTTYTVTGTIGPGDVVDTVSFVVPPASILETFIVRSFPPGDTPSSEPFSLRRGPGDFSDVIEFGNFPEVSPPGFDLLRINSKPGPQGPGIYSLSVGHPSLGEIPQTRSYLVELTVVPEPSIATFCLCLGVLLWLGARVPRAEGGE